MRKQPLIIATFMELVAIIYTSVIYDNIIIPFHVEHMSIEWIWLSIPAFLLMLGALAILMIHGTHTFSISDGKWDARDYHVMDKHKL